ncbi:MAG TPA: mandelate racemase/muconate lactonizing enzyme family protein [Candidatus Hydrogenedentes bacterium]|nr:mandelate racemase/muconate lactonizing enzyme family protein [Candidatus Hydrogenedentota bacterium]HNT88763.1 mandelate racemase/muconate lactonizing enzyme family protein [Candidatus Hydrogenedentota bacterium]
MSIAAIETYFFEHPLARPFHPTWVPMHEQTANRCLILKLITDDGLEGIAAASVFSEEQARLLRFIVQDTIGQFLIGADPKDVELLAEVVRLYGFMIGGRPWLVEAALWDLVGKMAGEPLCRYWGGARTELELYASTGELATVEHAPERALAARDAGFRAIKLRARHFDYREDLEAVRAVRAAVGDTMRILVDANQGWTLSPLGVKWDYETALAFCRGVEDLDVYWVEEPLHRFDYDGLARLRAAVDVPIAGGEMNQGMHEFKVLLEKDCLDVYQPDATLAGGVSVAREVARLALARGRSFSPHTWTNGIGFAINLQIAASLTECPFLEYPWEPESWSPEARDAMLTQPFLAKDGAISVPEGAGFGVTLNPEAMGRFAKRL